MQHKNALEANAIKYMEYIYFNSRDELLRVRTDKIVYFEADGNYTNIVAANKLCSIVGLSLSDMEKSLASQLGKNAAMFLRVGKRYIVNLRYVYKVNVQKQTLTLSDVSTFYYNLSVSKEALKNMKQLILESIKQRNNGTYNRS